jgi:hypothetical protein
MTQEKEHKGEILELSGPKGYDPKELIITGYKTPEGWYQIGLTSTRDRLPIHLSVEVIGLVDDVASIRNWIRDSSLRKEEE